MEPADTSVRETPCFIFVQPLTVYVFFRCYPMSLPLQLHHHVRHAKFVLIKEGDDWRQEFDTLDEAMIFAARLASGTIPLIELGEDGIVILESTIETAPFRLSGES